MDKQRSEMLYESGVDVNDALARFMGNEALLEKFLLKFCSDKNYSELKDAALRRDVDGMIRTSHSLKGMCGNLSMPKLFGLFTDQLTALRSGKTEDALRLMPQISEEYDKVVKSIKKS